MKISIITPTWNRAAQLRSALESVACQEAPPCEHIIIDNLSMDGTQELVLEYAKTARYPVRCIREADGGIYQAMNKGIAFATGEALYFLNDDDMLYDAQVLSMMSRCLKSMDADIIFGDVVLLDEGQKGGRYYRRHRQVNCLTLVERAITQQAILYRREAFDRCGGFNQELRIVADHDWLLRAFLHHDIRGIYLKRPVAVFRIGGVSNDGESAQAHRRERKLVTERYYSSREIKAARLYRNLLRKVPFGATLLNCFVPLRLKIWTLREKNGTFHQDPLAWIDL
ncbi:Glycosyltransferase involved in cell wall bisynthesis [Desulfonatronum thiosulfatophilum]|uniref:Glycosyltransferase involved in cell wall bisynthesis n=1 Tax=Desulfonatronum thiosulfatophilum TaxID=617002 RepID=A0A1G6BD61_9BACT|nr:glycosyltransferase family 2 protein [Desulfonatronum thiosulfatophilum]SDB18592.1 Glycosyltransferase involved in cell wall bisynthesis [Desulfonatronum thiosulfatophilum]